MTPLELRAAITYANGIDPRVQMTGPNADLWGRTIGHKTAAEAKAAIQVYYERPRINGREHPTIDPTSIRRIINEESDRAAAHTRALEPPPKHNNPTSYRQIDPQRWDALTKQGADAHKAALRKRGLEPHADTCTECQRTKPKTA